ncbi:hypothetical protein AB0D11_24245 [Streptomyces monashensis]|uniref:hypothetical protein n=1 Tax=Streptomyces monashensis TaxID=1678012 RepID=UPI0033CCC076
MDPEPVLSDQVTARAEHAQQPLDGVAADLSGTTSMARTASAKSASPRFAGPCVRQAGGD